MSPLGSVGQKTTTWRLGNQWPMTRSCIHASEATLAAMEAAFPHVVLCFLPPRRTPYLQPCDVPVFRSFWSCIQAQTSATLAGSVLDGSFEGLATNRAWRRQSSAEWAAPAVTVFCDKTRCGRLVCVACVPTATAISGML